MVQDCNQIKLTGPADAPTVVNGSGKAVFGYVLVFQNAAGPHAYFSFHYTTPSLAAGGSETVSRAVQQSTRSVALDLVVFADGEVQGPDTAHAFGAVADQINKARSFASKAVADHTLIETIARANRSKILRGHGAEVIVTEDHYISEQLYQIQEDSGLDAAIAAAIRLSLIPILWKG